jgi:hypothetical protein
VLVTLNWFAMVIGSLVTFAHFGVDITGLA